MKIDKMKRATLMLAALTLLLGSAGSASAALMTFDLAWSGASFENSAVATGQITFDPSLLTNPGFNSFTPTAFSITVSGASSGNGTFPFADFNDFVLDTGGNTLDFSHELIGQSTGGNPPWGPGGGDFNILTSLADANAPNGVGPFTLATPGSDGPGDDLILTSFAPAVPEPSSFILCGLGAIGLFVAARRRRKA